jgi:hypothetical protein
VYAADYAAAYARRQEALPGGLRLFFILYHYAAIRLHCGGCCQFFDESYRLRRRSLPLKARARVGIFPSASHNERFTTWPLTSPLDWVPLHCALLPVPQAGGVDEAFSARQ